MFFKKLLLILVLILICFATFMGCGDTSNGDTGGSALWYAKEQLSGKNIVFYGDSITAGHSTTGFSYNNSAQSQNSYPYLLTKEYGCGYRNYAVSGAKFTHSIAVSSNSASGVQGIYEHEKDNKWADIVFIAYCTNDFTNCAEIGNLNLSANSYDSVNTFAKAINFAVYTLKQHNPDVKIVFLTPLNRMKSNMPNHIYNHITDLYLKEDFGESIIERVRQLNEKGYDGDVIAIDMWDCFTKEEISPNTTYTVDGLHPNDLGHRKMADYIIDYLENMVYSANK